MAKKDSGQLFGGIFLIAMGSVFLLDRLDIITFREVVRTWWPMGMIVFGAFLLFSGDRDNKFGGMFMVLIGAIFQIGELDIFSWWRWKNMWPLMMIAFGGWLLYEHFSGVAAARERKSASTQP